MGLLLNFFPLQDIPTVNGNGNAQAAPITNGTGPKVSVNSNGMVNGFPKAGDDDWSRTSGPPRIGSLINELAASAGDATDHQTWVAANLDDKFYGGVLCLMSSFRYYLLMLGHFQRMVA